MPEIYDSYDTTPAYDYGTLTGGDASEKLPDSSLQDWGSWARNIGQTVITGAVDMYKYQAIGRNGGIPAVGTTGRIYTEGRTNVPPQNTVAGLGVSPTVLLLAAAGIAALLLLRK